MSLSHYYHSDDACPVAVARDLIREQARYQHGTWALRLLHHSLTDDARDLAREALGGDLHAYRVLCRINRARRMLRGA